MHTATPHAAAPQFEEPNPVALVTGASSGVGRELMLRLLSQGWRVLALQRSKLASEDPVVQAAMRDGRLSTHLVDLSVPERLAATLEQLAVAEPRIDLLVNNAGVSLANASAGASGRDLHFEVNVLAPYLITRALLPNVAASQHRTVLQVSSNALFSVKALSREELLRPSHFRKLLGPYAVSKLALSLWTQGLASLVPQGVTLLSACPGGNDTPMTRGAGMPSALRMLVPFLFRHPRQGADTLLAASVLHRGAAYPSGAFIVRRRPRVLPYQQRASEVLSWVEQEAAAV
jgi:NAD(P)-dependent dehydrogenase (short-subunit alcohol dehydrogenase family)